MYQIEEYIALPKEERQKHLRLDQPCIQRGGFSTECKVLLAHLHGTTVPKGKKIHVCHACHNAACTNPDHLYWGTASENKQDELAQRGMMVWDYSVEKYGLEEARRRQNHGKQSKAGKGNKGKPKSAEHRANLAKAATGKKRGPYKKHGLVAE